MSYLTLDPEFRALEKQLREMDRQRDHLRAQMADMAMRAEMEELSKNTPTFWLHPAIRHARMTEMAEKISKRAQRRAKEMERFGSYVRPGTWDADLDQYQEPKYEREVGDDYKVRLVRCPDLTWNAYVILPEGHPAIGKHWTFFGEDAPEDLPRPPVYLTYGGPDSERAVYGFYLSNTVKPREEYAEYKKHDFFSVVSSSPAADDGSTYMSYAKMSKLCMQLVHYFKALAENPKTVALCNGSAPPLETPEEEKPADVQYYTSMHAPTSVKPKKSWAAVVSGK